MDEKNITPALQQFYQVKSRYPDCIIFFRMGDFYEMFGDDAVVASKILGIQLTTRNKNSANQVPLCGVPYHAYLTYLKKLIDANKKVAICEQLEDPKNAVGIVKRGVIKVITAATDLDSINLNDYDNSFLMSLFVKNENIFSALIDVSTGEIYLKTFHVSKLDEEILKSAPKEIITNNVIDFIDKQMELRTRIPSINIAKDKVLSYYNSTTIESIFINDEMLLIPIAMALEYLDDLIISTKLRIPKPIYNEDFLYIDSHTDKTLELTIKSSSDSKTLFDTLNICKTAMGSRLLKSSIRLPLSDLVAIKNRYDIIEKLIANDDMLSTLRDLLADTIDLSRVGSRLISGNITPRELIYLKKALLKIPEISMTFGTIIKGVNCDITLNNIEDLKELLIKSLADEQPNSVKDGGVIRDGYNNLLDELRAIKQDSNNALLSIEQKEKVASGISQLKVGYNKIFGYYFEVTKANAHKVPDYFERKQTLVNAERFFTTELKTLENKILSADERAYEIELQLFTDIVSFAKNNLQLIRELSDNLAYIDMLSSLAKIAMMNKYIKPIIDNNYDLDIKNLRHPVIESMMKSDFIPNDINLNDSERMIILTGPNMSGKSTYLRSVAVLAVMAHLGSYVPASFCKIGVIDKIFTRIGANDNLTKGESTFMVEMSECADIVMNATKQSLIILDEVGRGTSTYDGISLATAISEYILYNIGAKTLFATHYYELTKVAKNSNAAVNYTVDVREWKEKIIFLRKVKKGVADKSYGIYVAELAHIPKEIIDRATSILKSLEEEKSQTYDISEVAHYDNDKNKNIISKLQAINTDKLSPIDALNLIVEIKKEIGGEK